MNRRLTAAIAALVLAGCGGGDGPDTDAAGKAPERKSSKGPAKESPEVARFIEKADEICAEFNDRWVGVPEATPEYYRDWKKSNADLEALDAPARISSEWNRYLVALKRQLRFTRAENGAELKEAYERKERAARQIGLGDCTTG